MIDVDFVHLKERKTFFFLLNIFIPFYPFVTFYIMFSVLKRLSFYFSLSRKTQTILNVNVQQMHCFISFIFILVMVRFSTTHHSFKAAVIYL